MTTEETTMEGNSPSAGASVPTPVSPDKSQLSAGDVAKLEKRLADQEAQIKALQSGKDKRWTEYEPILKRLSDEFGEDKVRELQRQVVLDEIIASKLGQSQPAQPSPAQVAQPAATVDVQSVVSDYGLDLADPFVAARVASLDMSKDVELQVARIVKDKTKQPSPTPAQAPASTGGGAAQSTPAELQAKYIEEAKAARGNRQAIYDIKDKYRKAGVPVDSIGFT